MYHPEPESVPQKNLAVWDHHVDLEVCGGVHVTQLISLVPEIVKGDLYFRDIPHAIQELEDLIKILRSKIN